MSTALDQFEKMKKAIRNIIVALVFSPLIILIYLTSIFVGKARAVALWGPYMTFLARLALRLLVPRIENPADFDKFRSKMKAKFWLWRPLFDFEVAEETKDTFKLHVRNCPFCEALSLVGLSKLNPYVCQGDWEIAKENRDRWEFERKHQIGTGDSFCDHTYKRIR